MSKVPIESHISKTKISNRKLIKLTWDSMYNNKWILSKSVPNFQKAQSAFGILSKKTTHPRKLKPKKNNSRHHCAALTATSTAANLDRWRNKLTKWLWMLINKQTDSEKTCYYMYPYYMYPYRPYTMYPYKPYYMYPYIPYTMYPYIPYTMYPYRPYYMYLVQYSSILHYNLHVHLPYG